MSLDAEKVSKIIKPLAYKSELNFPEEDDSSFDCFDAEFMRVCLYSDTELTVNILWQFEGRPKCMVTTLQSMSKYNSTKIEVLSRYFRVQVFNDTDNDNDDFFMDVRLIGRHLFQAHTKNDNPPKLSTRPQKLQSKESSHKFLEQQEQIFENDAPSQEPHPETLQEQIDSGDIVPEDITEPQEEHTQEQVNEDELLLSLDNKTVPIANQSEISGRNKSPSVLRFWKKRPGSTMGQEPYKEKFDPKKEEKKEKKGKEREEKEREEKEKKEKEKKEKEEKSQKKVKTSKGPKNVPIKDSRIPDLLFKGSILYVDKHSQINCLPIGEIGQILKVDQDKMPSWVWEFPPKQMSEDSTKKYAETLAKFAGTEVNTEN